MYILRRNRGGGSYKDGPQRTAAVLVLEALLTLLVIFNPLFTWDFATSSGGSLLYKIVRWPLLRVGLVEQPYKTYVGVFYTLVGLVAATYVAAAWLAILLHRNDSSKLLRKLAGYLSWAAEWGFGVAYLMLIDYMAHLYVCDFYGGSGSTGMSLVWPAVDCLAMPHVVHMSVAAVFIVLTTALALMVVITNCDLNPVCRHWLGSPCAGTKAQVVLLKVATALLAHLVPASMPILQATLMMLAQAYVLWIHVTQIPYYHKWVNAAYCGLQAAVVYAAALLLALAKLPADRSTFVTLVLAYGVAPAVLTGGGLSLAWQAAFAWRLARFRGVDPKSKLKLVYRFHRLQDVELLARCCRCYDGDGLVRPDAAALAELVVKVAKARSPSSAYLLVLQANYQLNVLHDGPAARTQLQLALKNSPSMLLRFQIYATTEISKLTKDGAEGSLDLVAYVEFKRNLRTVLRVHRDVLQQQRDFWRSLLSDTAKAKAIRDGLADIERAVDRATQVYRRVRERYPTNPKLLTCYGRFLEDVRNDPWAANRLYVEASRYSDNDAMNVDLALNPDAPAFLQSMDMNEDAVIIINGEGVIMMVNNQVSEEERESKERRVMTWVWRRMACRACLRQRDDGR